MHLFADVFAEGGHAAGVRVRVGRVVVGGVRVGAGRALLHGVVHVGHVPVSARTCLFSVEAPFMRSE